MENYNWQLHKIPDMEEKSGFNSAKYYYIAFVLCEHIVYEYINIL